MPRRTREEYNAYMKTYMAHRYQRRMRAAIEQLGGKCALCDATEGLQFDHIDRSTKLANIAVLCAGASERRLQEELAKCQLLCHSHHKAKTKVEVNAIERECCGRTFVGLQAYRGHKRWCPEN